MTRLFIDGAAGTTGLEIAERIAGRPEFSVIQLDASQRRDDAARRDALNAADIAVLCLPDDAARAAVALIDNPHTRVVDASSAHRTAPGWTYGFPELGFDVAGAMRVSNPGCYPTGFLALVAPLVRARLIARDTPLVVHGTSGYSGGGKPMIAAFQDGRGSAHRAYALDLAHKHLPEMRDHAGLAAAPIFLPSVADTFRGMIVEVAFHARARVDAIRTILRDTFEGTLVMTADDDVATIDIEEHAGRDGMSLRVFGNEAQGHLRLVATLDNLGKGASGAAVQNLNLMTGLDPHAGLTL